MFQLNGEVCFRIDEIQAPNSALEAAVSATAEEKSQATRLRQTSAWRAPCHYSLG